MFPRPGAFDALDFALLVGVANYTAALVATATLSQIKNSVCQGEGAEARIATA